ncbi:MAG: Ycf48-like protein [Ignavibacteria bacterium]|nr:Ycf48-like protein [Ignavibacteria bacterium]
MKSRINIILVLYFILLFVQTSKAQWFTQQSGTTAALYDIEFINDKTGWCCGDGGYIIKTTNGGENWIQQGFGVTFEPLFGIHPVDSNVVYAVGFYRTVVKTTNGGTTWIKIQSGQPGDGIYTCVFFINSNTGWIGNFDSPEYGVRRTTDGGVTITSVPFSGFPEDMYFKDSLNGVGVGGLSYIYRTTNGGINWSSYSIVQNGDLYRVSFINENTGFTASRRAAYKTTNFGLSWDSVGNIPVQMGSVTSAEFSSENTGWAGTQYQIYKTTTGGRVWFLQILTGVVYNIYSVNDSLVWTCGNGGRIWHTTTGGISFVTNLSNNVPENFELKQNYPNPFNSTTTINFHINKDDEYRLEIYNALGQLISKAFEQKFHKGIYQLIFDANGLGSGIYFYRLSSKKFSQTRKFLLIK